MKIRKTTLGLMKINEKINEFSMVQFTLRAICSRKSLRTDSLVDDSRALVVKQVFLFKGSRHGLEVAASKGLLWFGFKKEVEEGEESDMHVKECMFVQLLW